MENKFQLQDKINANKALSFADKAILNQIISFTKDGGICIATNSYFAKCWGVDEQKIKRTLKILYDHGLINSKVERKKHTEGERTWHNKRYLTVNHNVLASFLDGKPSSEKSSTSTPATVASSHTNELEYDDALQLLSTIMRNEEIAINGVKDMLNENNINLSSFMLNIKNANENNDALIPYTNDVINLLGAGILNMLNEYETAC